MAEIAWIDPATGKPHVRDHICNQQCLRLKAEAVTAARAKMTEEEKDAEHLEYLKWATDTERVLVMAENSESTDAIVLAMEIRRLRKLVDEIAASTLEQVAEDILKPTPYEFQREFVTCLDIAHELREKAKRYRDGG